jgi:hypothetical protein
MNEKFKAIKDYFEEHGHVALAKQCKKEYIVYSYYTNFEGNVINRMLKQHFKNRDLEVGKNKRKKVEIPIAKFFKDVIYDLLNRGYELEDWQ